MIVPCVTLFGGESTPQALAGFDAWVEARRADIRDGRVGPADAEHGRQLAVARRAAFKALMQADPAAAWSAAVDPAVSERLPAAVRAQLESRVAGRARLLVACEMPAVDDHDHDDPDHRCLARMVRQVEIGGRTYAAHVPRSWEAAPTGEYDQVEALVLEDAAALGDTGTTAPSPLPSPTGELPTNVTGATKVLYIIARFNGEGSDPISAATAVSRMQVTSDYFRNNSHDRTYFTGLVNTTAGGTLMDIVTVTLPSAGSTYTNAFSTLLGDARAAAAAQGFAYADYNLDVTVTSNGGSFSYAGKAWLGSQGLHLRSDYTSLRTAGHEIGHNLGLPHAYYWRTDSPHPLGEDSNPGGYVNDTALAELGEYWHYFSMMSAQYGSEMDDATKPHFSAMEKQKLGWFTIGTSPSAQVQQVGTSGTYRIYRHDTKLQTGTPRGIQITTPATMYTGSTSYRYWLEYRYAPWTTAQNFQRYGLHVDVSTGSYPIELDMTPYTSNDSTFYNASSPPGNYWTIDNNDKRDGALLIGRTYSDRTAGIHITPIARNAASAGEEYIDAVINIGTFAGNRAPAISAYAASATSAATGVPVTFTVSASDPDGDALAYGWTMDPLSAALANGHNAPSASASWATAGQYRVTVTVSDMKGGIASETLLVTVGAPASTGRIGGRVLWGGRPVADARVLISGVQQGWTDSDGSYLLSGLAAGTHTVSIQHDSLDFSAQFTNPVSLAAGEYTTGKDWYATQAYPDPGAAATYSVSGTITDSGTGVSGAVVSVAGKAVTTAANGTWTVTGVTNGTWPVTVAKAGMVFPSANAGVSGGNVTGLAIARAYYGISGRVSVAAQNVAITVRAGSYTVNGLSIKQGNNYFYDYAFTALPAGSYTVVAAATGYQTTPGFTNPVDIASGSSSNRNFSSSAAGSLYQIRGVVTLAGAPVAGVAVTAGGQTATTGPDGAYVLGGLAAGSYTVTPSISGGSFTPATIAATITSADLTAQNFALVDAAPTVQTAAAAAPSTVTTPTGSTALSVLGSDNLGESTLTYTWRATTAPYPVTFSANGSNAAKNVTATFQGGGAYQFQATVTDARGQTATSTVAVTVQSPVASYLVTVTPYERDLAFGDTQQFTATVWAPDGTQVAGTPAWSAAGGSISGSGLYQATGSSGTYTITAVANGATGSATVRIIGNAGPTVSIATTDATAGEPGLGLGDGMFTLTRSITNGPLTVTYGVGGTATAGGDYTALSGSAVMEDGVASVQIPVAVLDDTAVEAHETVTVTLVADAAYNLGTTTSGTVTIKDDEAPVVTITANDNAAGEPGVGGGNGAFTLTRSGNPDATLAVQLAMGGLVSAGDYTGVGATAAIAGGTTTTVLTLVPVNDSESELAETAILTVAAGSGYAVGSPSSGTVTISDDDPVVVRVATTDAVSSEQSSDDGVFTVTRLGNRSAAVNVAYVLSGTAVNGTDYAPRTGVVAVNSNSNTATVSIDPTDDSLYEGPETAVITLSASGGYTVGSPASDSVTIADNDKPTVSVAATDALADEAGGTAVFTVSRSGVTGLGDLTVAYTVSGSAVAGGDYQSLSGTVVIPQGQASATVTLTPLADDLVEAPETVTVTIATATAYTVAGSPANAATAMLVDDTEMPMLTVATGDNTASEPAKGDGSATFVITRAGSPSAALSVAVAVSGSAVSGSDYQAIGASVTIPAGQTSLTVTLTPVDDAVAEPDETATLTLQAGAGYGLGNAIAATVNLYDDEAAQVAVEISDADCTEAATPGNGQYLLRRLGNRSAALTVAYAMSGTATSGGDYTALAGSAALGANSGSTTVTLTPINDALIEGPETAILTVSVGTGYTPAATAAGTIEIRDDETPDVTVAVQDGVCGEPADAGSFRITRSAASASPLTVTFTVSGTAVAGSDYTALSGSAAIPANGTTVDVTVTPVADALVEGPETVVLTLTGAGTAYDLGLARSATLVLRDDEVPTVTVAASDAAAAEPADAGVFTLTASPAPASPLTVAYAMSGSAGNGSDYQTLGGTVVIAAGATTATVVVAPVDDALSEGSETATLTLAAGSGYNVGTTSGVSVTIAANDTPVATVTAVDAAAAEAGLDAARFQVALSNPASGNTTVTYSVGGTATAGSDYTALTGSVTVSAGQTSALVTVTPLDDVLSEGGETVAITLTAAAAYTLGSPASATAAIADDEGGLSNAAPTIPVPAMAEQPDLVLP